MTGTYFNCIMFMVASSVVSTIMVLNYHHRLVDTHEMPDWVKQKLGKSLNKRFSGPADFPSMDALVFANVPPWGKDNQKDNSSSEKDERVR